MPLWLHVTEAGGTVTAIEGESSTMSDPESARSAQNTPVGVSIAPKPKANLELEYRLEFSPKT